MLDDMQKVISMSQLAKNPERIARDIAARKTTYRVRGSSGHDIVMMDRDYYEGWLATVQFIAQHPNWRKEFEEGDRALAAGECRDLGDALKELGLDDHSSDTRGRAPARRAAARRRTTRRRSPANSARRSS